MGRDDRTALERLCRYLLRPPLAVRRLTRLDDGRYRYALKAPWSDGTTALLLEPFELIERPGRSRESSSPTSAWMRRRPSWRRREGRRGRSRGIRVHATHPPDGTLLFAASSGGTSSDSAQGVTVVDGAAWVTGWFGGDATFDVVGTSATGSSEFYLLRRPL